MFFQSPITNIYSLSVSTNSISANSIFSNSLSSYFESIHTWNRDDITFYLALIGSVYSIISTLYILITSRKNISIQIFDYTKVYQTVQFFMCIRNNSRLPISISCISIIYGDKEYPCELIQKKIRGTGEDLIRTPQFPLNLTSQLGIHSFFEFVNSPDIELTLGKNVDFLIYTNRGVLKKSVVLPEKSHYLHNV